MMDENGQKAKEPLIRGREQIEKRNEHIEG